MHSSVTSAVAMCAALYAASMACSTSSPDLPPVEASGMAGSLCQIGDSCKENGSYCFAGGGQGCRYLECVDDAWHCPTDAGRDAAQDVQSQ